MTEEKLRRVLKALRDFSRLQQQPEAAKLRDTIEAALAEPPRVQTIPRANLDQFLEREGR